METSFFYSVFVVVYILWRTFLCSIYICLCPLTHLVDLSTNPFSFNSFVRNYPLGQPSGAYIRWWEIVVTANENSRHHLANYCVIGRYVRQLQFMLSSFSAVCDLWGYMENSLDSRRKIMKVKSDHRSKFSN